MGLTPTSTDNADIAAGYIPTVFFDGGHPIDAGYTACARFLANYFFVEQGWV
jgi:hypothetical protein